MQQSIKERVKEIFDLYYPSYGDFDVRLIACNTAGCDTLFLPAFIHEFQLPPSPVITSSFDTLFSTAAYAYQWYDSAGVIPGATNSYYVYQQQGSYFVIITDSNGCASSSGTINTGLEEQFSVSALTIFPNPSDGRFTVTSGLNHPGTSAIRLYDAWGRLVIQQVSATEKTNMVTDLPAGIYQLEWVLPGKIYRQRVLIQK